MRDKSFFSPCMIAVLVLIRKTPSSLARASSYCRALQTYARAKNVLFSALIHNLLFYLFCKNVVVSSNYAFLNARCPVNFVSLFIRLRKSVIQTSVRKGVAQTPWDSKSSSYRAHFRRSFSKFQRISCCGDTSGHRTERSAHVFHHGRWAGNSYRRGQWRGHLSYKSSSGAGPVCR